MHGPNKIYKLRSGFDMIYALTNAKKGDYVYIEVVAEGEEVITSNNSYGMIAMCDSVIEKPQTVNPYYESLQTAKSFCLGKAA